MTFIMLQLRCSFYHVFLILYPVWRQLKQKISKTHGVKKDTKYLFNGIRLPWGYYFVKYYKFLIIFSEISSIFSYISQFSCSIFAKLPNSEHFSTAY